MPEGGGAEQDGARRRLEALDQRHLAALALQEERPAVESLDRLMHPVHDGVAGEQQEGAAGGQVEQGCYLLHRAVDKLRIARFRHLLREVEQRLPAMIEGRGRDAAFRLLEAEPLLEKVEAAVDGQRRGGQHCGVELFEQLRPQELGDVYRRGRQDDVRPAAQFHAVNEARIGAIEHVGERLLEFLRPAGQ